MGRHRIYADAQERQREASRRRRDRDALTPRHLVSAKVHWRRQKAERENRELLAAQRAERKAERLHASLDVVALYRAEKVGFLKRSAAKIEEAKDAYARLMADLAMKAKGGRPRRKSA